MKNFQKKTDLLMNNKVVNWHEHVWFKPGTRVKCRRLRSVSTICKRSRDGLSGLFIANSRWHTRPDDIKHCNDTVAVAMKRHPKIIKGMAFINPGYTREALDEIDRCINELGMIGVKLYNHYFIRSNCKANYRKMH